MKIGADGKTHINVFPLPKGNQRKYSGIRSFMFLTYTILGGIWEKIYTSLNPLRL